MMSDVVLQVLLILAYLAIGLIAITFPIYAICVTFLPQEKWESEKDREKRIERLQAKISELTSRLRTEPSAGERIKEEMAKCEAELKGTKLRVHCLTARGAVGLPVSYLALSLLMVGVGLYYFNSEYLVGVVVFAFVSVFFSAMAVYRLYKTITAVEYAALRPARTIDYEVCFYSSGEKSREIKQGKEIELTVGVKPLGVTVENIVIKIFVPPEIQIKKVFSPGAYVTLQPEKSSHPNYNMVSFGWDVVHLNSFLGVSFEVLAENAGKYNIPVIVDARGTYPFNTELILGDVK